MKAPDTWGKRVEDYLIYRHNLGFDLVIESGLLRQFARYADQTESHDRLTVALAVAWAKTSTRSTLITWGRRLEVDSNQFFLLDGGKPATQRAIRYALRQLCQRLGWNPRGDYKYHRLQDMRHTFVVRSILHFYNQEIDIDHAVAALSTYVGHAQVIDTYWYATAIPDLMNIAAQRFYHYTWGKQ